MVPIKRIFSGGLCILFIAHFGFSIENRPVLELDHAPNEYIVKLKPRVNKNILNLFFSLGVEKIEPIHFTDNFFIFKTKPDVPFQEFLNSLNTNENIEYAEPNFRYFVQKVKKNKINATALKSSALPNDPAFMLQWSLNNTGQLDSKNNKGQLKSDMNILPVWQSGMVGSSKVIVAVIDSGVQWEHPDLKENIFTNIKEIPENGIDDDRNGFIDDLHGWNFADGTNDSSDNEIDNHGTHCAGIIGGVGNNGLGVAGVAWNVKILPIKFMNEEGVGLTGNAIQGIHYARMMGAKVMNNSWGSEKYSKSLEEAIQKARDAGILFIAAAGNKNSNNDRDPIYPASYNVDNVISVAALGNQNNLASFSNWGKKQVDVAAPGVEILSTVFKDQYEFMSGTSMAAPHVAGLAALILSKEPFLSPLKIKERLIRTSTKVSGLQKKVVAKGSVNAYNALYGKSP